MNIHEFEPYLDFWLEGQRKGFAGDLPREKLPDDSKFVLLRKGKLLYIDRWYGSDIGGGQTILYDDALDNPEKIIFGTPASGKPIARLGYSGEIIRRFTEDELKELRKVFCDISQSNIIWRVLKSALSQVSRKRFLRGPIFYQFPEFPDFIYCSKDRQEGNNRIIGSEDISMPRKDSPLCFIGDYDFTLIKRNLEDRL